MADPHDTCANCKWYEKAVSIIGTCRRYPTTVAKSASDWCGEYSPRPVYDIATDTVVTPKRRGRPPKND